ncbi:MAG: hypothetical protein AMJ56_12485 [Anaerolineae bacterium SG8_19]|nr:MAG: hypothetical protein AMJ56_12485 [Anaerolineae bacterium SG8_19]
MYYLALLFPFFKGKRLLPLSRDQLMLLMAAINQVFLSVDIYLAHNLNGTIRPREWIPIVFGVVAGALLLLAGLIALRWRRTASIIASLVLIASIIVGLMGAYFHIVRAIRPTAPLGEIVTIPLLVWAPPIVGPLIFSLVGLWGVSAAWVEDPPDSGILKLWGDTRLRLPLSKTRAYLFMVSLGTLATLLSSVLDHGRAQFENPWLWPPIAVGVFATVVAFGLAAIDWPTRGDVGIYFLAMVLLLLVGVVGFVLHIQFDLTTQNAIVPERFLRGAPFLAPMLFANMGMVGLIAILNPAEEERGVETVTQLEPAVS